MNRLDLLSHHLQLIEASSITHDVAAARGYRSVLSKDTLAALGFSPAQQLVPTLLFPVHGVAGGILTHQHRPDAPRSKKKGTGHGIRVLKYETPSGSRMVLDVPPTARQWIGDPSIPLYITEGARKADAAVSRELCCLSLLGVWNWRGTNANGGKAALGDWDSIALNGRTVYLCFDSDAMTKKEVQCALDRLCRFLETREAKPVVLYLPHAADGAKVGLDDFFAAGHDVDELLALTAPPTLQGQNDGGSRADRPEIDTANLGLDDMAHAAWMAIEAANTPPKMFLYAGTLAWLVVDMAKATHVEILNQDHVRHHLADVARFIRWSPGRQGGVSEKKPAFPPLALAADLLAVPRATLPRLERVVRMPVFTQDGRLLTSSGYDAASALYLALPDLTLPAISSAPSARDVTDARDLLCKELLGDFPFVGDADMAHAVALLLTPLMREVVAGCVPLFVVSKPTPRTGAGLLTKVMSIVQEGSPIAATTISRDEEEMRKQLTSLLISAPALLLLDNLHGRLDSAALAAILTTPIWQDRLLGRSQTLRLSIRSTFVVTGNNVAMSNEMAGRAVLIRLDPKVEDPATRTGFRHPDLEVWATADRHRLLWAALVLGQAWVAAGQPLADIAFGGFAAWAAVLGGVLRVAGIPGFLGNRQQLFDQADEESARIRAFLADWWQTHHDAPVMVKALIDLAKEHPLPIAGRSEQGTLVRLGQLIKTLEDRRYDLGECRVAVRRAGEVKRAVLWRLAGESAESAESSSVNTRAHARAQAPAQAREQGSAERDSSDSQTHIVELRL